MKVKRWHKHFEGLKPVTRITDVPGFSARNVKVPNSVKSKMADDIV